MPRLPLFLEGDAFLVFSRMPSANKKRDHVKDTTVMSFSAVQRGKTHAQFTSRKLTLDQNPGVLVADLRCLQESSGHEVKDDKDTVMTSQMLAGLPRDSSSQVCLSFAGKDLTLSGCLDAVHALVVASGLTSSTGTSCCLQCCLAPIQRTWAYQKCLPKTCILW